MRVSVDSNDPGWTPHLIGHVKVFFEGAERRYVFTADEEKRMCIVYVLDDNGNLMLNESRTEILTETIYGHVRIDINGHPADLIAAYTNRLKEAEIVAMERSYGKSNS